MTEAAAIDEGEAASARADLSNPASDAHRPLVCDLVMKGGVTSGVMYPLAVSELATTYRFRNIGGTSAGAISAGVISAAAAAVAPAPARALWITPRHRTQPPARS
jgi:predicted acylesterase/phospholipase RssA